VKYALEKNGAVVTHAVMSGPVGYKVYQYPVKTELVFDNEEKAQEVATLIGAKVIEYFFEKAIAA
tara:strand:+ start:814 stop:1008 length:195 start_codon:yes stop_codon:yes gene_type:complete